MVRRTCILLLTVTLLGCGGQATMAQTDGREQTRAFADDCLFRKATEVDEAALSKFLDAATGGVIKGTLGRIGKALRAAGEEDADVVIGRYPAEFEPGNPAACIFVAKGLWTSEEKKAWKFTDATGGEHQFQFPDSRFLQQPDFFLEVAVERSSGGNALRLVPNYFHYVRMIEDPMKKGRNSSRGIAFEISVHPPSAGPKGKGAVGASLVLGALATGYAYDLRSGARAPLNDTGGVQWGDSADGYLPLEYTSAWFPTFAPEAAKATNKKKPGVAASAGAAASTPQPGGASEEIVQLLPRTVTVTFTETRAPRKFLLFLADVFDASQAELQAAAELAVIESKQAEAELAAVKASTTLMTDYVSKQAAAEVKILEYCAAGATQTERITKSSAANVAQRTANFAALAASQPQPYTDFVEAGDGDPNDSGFCP